MNWEIDTVFPFKCTTGKAGDVKRFKTLNDALVFADKEPGRVLVTGWVQGKFKIYLYRFL